MSCNKMELPKEVSCIIKLLNERGHEAYAVGGAVRDTILGRSPEDWDVTTSALPDEIKSIFNRTVDTGIEHGTVTVLMKGRGYEVTTYRVDGEYLDSRHPKDVKFTRNLSEDLLRRDFTINAMAYNNSDGLVDEYGGEKDLEDGIIRCVGDPVKRFEEDALRMLRAVRFSAQLGFSIHPDTREAIIKLAHTIKNISCERIRDELLKLIESDNPGHIRELYNLGLTKYILPEFDEMMACEQNSKHHMYNVGEHTIHAMENIESDRVLRLTMLLHDMAKPSTKTQDEEGYDHFYNHQIIGAEMANKTLRSLKLDNNTRKKVVNLVRYHDERPVLKEKKVRKCIVETGLEAFPNIFAVKRADTLAQSMYKREEKLKYIDDFEAMYNDIVSKGQCLRIADMKISGKDLIEMGVRQGPDIGDILQELFEDVLNNPSHNEEQYLKERAAKLLLKRTQHES